MLKSRILALMIICFGLSQSSSLLISLLHPGKYMTSVLIDSEETEQMEKMEFESDEAIDDFIFDLRSRIPGKLKKRYPEKQKPINASYANSPETPPPNLV